MCCFTTFVFPKTITIQPLFTLLLLASIAVRSWAIPIENIGSIEQRAISYVVNQDRADAIKDAFQFGWDGYYQYAFPHDQLEPVTNGYSDPR